MAEARIEEIKYDFETIDRTDYLLTLTLFAKGKYFDMVFNGAAKKYKDIEKLNEFALDSRYYNYMAVILRPKISEVRKIVNQDGIQILSHKVISGIYKKLNENWQIIIKITGNYYSI